MCFCAAAKAKTQKQWHKHLGWRSLTQEWRRSWIHHAARHLTDRIWGVSGLSPSRNLAFNPNVSPFCRPIMPCSVDASQSERKRPFMGAQWALHPRCSSLKVEMFTRRSFCQYDHLVLVLEGFSLVNVCITENSLDGQALPLVCFL